VARRSKAWPHSLKRPPKKSAGTPYRSSLAATIEQLSDVANDIAVGMCQQDAVTPEIARNAGASARALVMYPRTSPKDQTAPTASAELAEQSHLLGQEVERYHAQLRVAS
jgi:hypothetical protein